MENCGNGFGSKMKDNVGQLRNLGLFTVLKEQWKCFWREMMTYLNFRKWIPSRKFWEGRLEEEIIGERKSRKKCVIWKSDNESYNDAWEKWMKSIYFGNKEYDMVKDDFKILYG